MLNRPKQLFIETTNLCNANCIFCAYQFNKDKKITMPIDKLASILEEYRHLGGDTVNFTPLTGEVFTDRQFLDKVKLARDLGFKQINTFTNATSIDKFDLDEIYYSGLTNIMISVSGLNEEIYKLMYRKNSYQRVLTNILSLAKRFHELDDKMLQSLHISFRADRPKVDMEKFEDFSKLKPYLFGGVSCSYLTHYDNWAGQIKEEDLLPGMFMKDASFDKTLTCDRMFMLKVTADGKYRACGCRVDYSAETDDFYLGHSDSNSILEVYNSTKMLKLKNSFKNKVLLDECKKCSWYENFRYSGVN